jgi:hypothetical protein
MAFARSVLETHAWDAYSLAEDSEYTLTLLGAGVRVRWAGDVTVRSDAAATVSQLGVQRRRWVAALSGRPGTTARDSAGRWRRLDARLTRLVMSRPLVLGITLSAASFAGGCYLAEPDPVGATLAAAGAATVGLQGLYLLAGVVGLGITRHRLRLLAATPAVVVRLLAIAVRGVAGSAPRAWVRTPRVAVRAAAEAG